MVSFRPLLLSVLFLLWGVPAHSASHLMRRAPTRTSRLTVQTDGALSVNFFSLPGSPRILAAQGSGVVDLGKVSYATGSNTPGVSVERMSRAFDVRTSVGLRIGNVGEMGGGTAMLKVWLESPADPYGIWLDGVRLTTQPAVVDEHAQVGVVTPHELRIRVPSSATDKQATLQTEISVQVIRN